MDEKFSRTQEEGEGPRTVEDSWEGWGASGNEVDTGSMGQETFRAQKEDEYIEEEEVQEVEVEAPKPKKSKRGSSMMIAKNLDFLLSDF